MLSIDCGSRQSDEKLIERANTVGNINLRYFGCSNDDFFASLSEIRDYRVGKLDMSTYGRPFDAAGTAIYAFLGIVGTILASIIAVGSIVLGRWVWFGTERA